MEDVLLIYPKTGIDPVNPQPPTSLMPLAAVLETQGYSPKIIDSRVTPNYERKIKKHINNAILVGISSMTGFQIYHGLKISKFIKGWDASIPIVWGGVHPTFNPVQTVKNENVDIIVRGEGEVVLPQLVRSFKGEFPLDHVNGLTYKFDGDIKSTPPETRVPDLDEISLPWHLVDVCRYIGNNPYIGKKTISIYTSRGCPSRCGFCYNLNFHNRRWRGKSNINVIKEIRVLIDNYGVNGINFSEDNFFANKKRVSKICRSLIKEDYDLSWGSTCRADYFSRFNGPFISLLKESGCTELAFGAESGSERILSLIQKDITTKQIKKTVQKCSEYGITPRLSFMMGLPTETEEDLMATIDLIDEVKKIDPSVEIGGLFFYTPFPGTPLYDLSIKNGFEPPKTLEEWGDYSFLTIAPKLPWLNRKDIHKMNYLTYLVRLVHLEEEVRKKFNNPAHIFGYNVIKKVGDFRWKHRYFGFPLEGIILDRFFKAYSRGD